MVTIKRALVRVSLSATVLVAGGLSWFAVAGGQANTDTVSVRPPPAVLGVASYQSSGAGPWLRVAKTWPLWLPMAFRSIVEVTQPLTLTRHDEDAHMTFFRRGNPNSCDLLGAPSGRLITGLGQSRPPGGYLFQLSEGYLLCSLVDEAPVRICSFGSVTAEGVPPGQDLGSCQRGFFEVAAYSAVS